MDIKDAWGYCGIVFAKKLQWQGLVILDPASATVASGVKKAIDAACSALSFRDTPRLTVEGALMAGAVECLQRGNEGGLGIFCSAVSQYTGHRFWVVDADAQEGGTETRLTPLDVLTPEAAREAINSRVAPLKMGLALRAMRL